MTKLKFFTIILWRFKWCQVSSDHRQDMPGGGLLCKAQLLSSNFLLLRLHPLQSSRLWGLVARRRGLSHPVWGCINSILIFPNCCLYQVLSLRLTSEPRPADRCFLSKTRIVRSVLCYLYPPSCHILWLSTVLWCRPRWKFIQLTQLLSGLVGQICHL